MKPGIVSYGLYFPEEFETADEIADLAGISSRQVRALGIEKKHKPSASDQPVTMASKAAASALDAAEEISSEDVDVVLYTGEEYKDYIAQTAAIRLQEELGCRRAFAFDLVGQGVSMLTGLRVAGDMMTGDREINTVLLAGGTRNIDLVDYKRADTRFLLPYSASGAAVLLRGGCGQYFLENLVFIADPEMADQVCVPGGGTSIPFAEDNLDSKVMFYQTADPQKVSSYLKRRWPAGLVDAARKAAEDRKIDYLAMRHTSPAERDFILSELGLSDEKSAKLYDLGHHGSNDVIISLDLGLKQGAAGPGSRVVMVSGGTGFEYAAAYVAGREILADE